MNIQSCGNTGGNRQQLGREDGRRNASLLHYPELFIY